MGCSQGGFGGDDDVLSAAVVDFAGQVAVVVAAGQGGQVLGVGAAEPVDGLVGVCDGDDGDAGQVVQGHHEFMEDAAEVLVFVHDEVREPGVQEVPDGFVLPHDAQGPRHHGLEVGLSPGGELFLAEAGCLYVARVEGVEGFVAGEGAADPVVLGCVELGEGLGDADVVEAALKEYLCGSVAENLSCLGCGFLGEGAKARRISFRQKAWTVEQMIRPSTRTPRWRTRQRISSAAAFVQVMQATPRKAEICISSR